MIVRWISRVAPSARTYCVLCVCYCLFCFAFRLKRILFAQVPVVWCILHNICHTDYIFTRIITVLIENRRTFNLMQRKMDLDSELLCSPRKIRRLESDNATSKSRTEINQKFSQGSQESRATSTPTRRGLMKKLSISSDLSSIVDQESLAAIITEEEVDASDLLTLIEELSLNGSSVYTLDSEILHRPNPRMFRGKVWNYLKPKYEESLYFKIMGNIDNIEDTVFEFLEELRSDEKTGTLKMIKFFVDLCGYQWAKIEGHFDFDKDFCKSCEKVIKMMEFDFVNDEMLEAKTYIFFEADKHTKLGGTLATAVNSFIDKLMIGAYGQNILFSRSFHKYIFQFLFYMCQGILRSIRHTGVTLVRMFLKVLNHIHAKILNKLEFGESQREVDRLPVAKELEYAERYIQHFYEIFSKNSFIPDPKLYMLRAKNVKEMGSWMTELPQVYFSKCTACLLKLILDESDIVRLSVVQVWKNLIRNKNVHLHVVKCLNDVVTLIKGRLRDAQLRVVVEAVDFFSVLVDHHHKAINNDTVNDITELIYADSYLCAKAAGFFTIKFLNSCKLSEIELLKKFVDLTTVPRFQKMKHFFVEAFMEHNTVLENYKLMMDVLLSRNKENASEMKYGIALFELMYNSVYQKLRGEPLTKRKHSFTVVPTASCHEDIANVFLLNLKNFINIYRDQNDVLNYLFKILILIDFDVLTSSYRPHLVLLSKSCRIIFLNETDEEMLGNICKVYHYLCFEKRSCLKDELHKMLLNLFENISSYLQGYLESQQEESFEHHFLRVGKLYEKFNMNTCFDWDSLYTVWKGVLCKGQMISCHHFIIWTIKELIKDRNTGKEDALRMKKISLKHHFSKYTESLVQIMTSDAEDKLKLDAFDSFCFLHIFAYQTVIKDTELSDFKQYILDSLKTHVPDTVVKFFRNHVVHDKSTTFERRKKLICDWSMLILNGLTDVLYIIPLFECYHTRSEEYSSLIEFVAAKIFAKNQEVFCQLILAVLVQSVKHVFLTLCRSLTSPEARELMALAVKFANMKEFSKCSQEILKMLHLGFKHCFKDELYQILFFISNFLPRLSEEQYKDCLQMFKMMTPKEIENKEYIKAFRAKLQEGKTKGIGKTINKTTSSSDILQDNTPDSKKENVPKKRRTGNNRKSLVGDQENTENKTPKKNKTPKTRKSKNK